MKIILLILLLIPIGVSANEDFKQYLKEWCYNHELAKKYSHWKNDWNNWERCYKIGSAQAKYETNWGKLWAWKTHNNIYWFRRHWFMYFENKWESIDWYVNRYYKFDRYKTINQIVSWGCYVSPIDWIYKCFPWFTFNEEHQKNYYEFVKDYFNKN